MNISELAEFRGGVSVNTITNSAAPISLSNNAATTVVTIAVASGVAGKIEGSLQILASGTGTSYTTWCGCAYSRQPNGTTYNIGGAFFCDDIPSGLAFSATGSAIQITLPDVPHFTSASYKPMKYV